MRQHRPAPSRRDPLDLAGGMTGPLDRDVARLTVRVSALLASAAAVGFALMYLVTGPSEFIAPNVAAATALVVVALAPFRDWTRQMYVGVTVGMTLLAVQLLLLGRIDTGSTVWFLVPPLAAMLAGARGVAVYCGAFAVTVIVVVVLARELAWPILGDVVLPIADLVMALSVAGAIITTGAVAEVTLRARRSLMADAETRTLDLAAALQEARAARAEAVEAGEAKDRFFANLTHEIRTPLNGIAGTTELLRLTGLSAEQRPLVDALTASNANLVALVNAMLDHARLRAGHVSIDLGAADIRRWAADLGALFSAHAADHGLELAVRVDDDVPAWVETDAMKLRQIVGNLVGNAIKFTEQGSVSVVAGLAPEDATQAGLRLVVTVTDTGVGIPPEKARSIFEPFIQGDASISRTHGGTGLGLAIANQLAELLGGTLAVRSRQGVGSVFTLSVPVRPVAAPADAADADATPVASPLHPTRAVTDGADGVRVLLVEDNEINRTVASRMLHKLAAEVRLAANGLDAVELAAEHAFHLILMDLQMPGMDGIEAARAIRRAEAERGAAAVPIVAMTGNDPADYGEACAAAGMNGFLMKPVALAELSRLLNGLPARDRTPA